MTDAAPGTVRLAGIVDESVVDGPGVRLVVFAQGCPHRCPGCHNPHTWDFYGGMEVSIEEVLLRAEANPILSGITLSGGEPFAQAPGFARLAQEAGRMGLSVVTYTGYTWEQLVSSPALGVRDLLLATDILIDGPFIQALADPGLAYRGSRNQRVIQVRSRVRTTLDLSLTRGPGHDPGALRAT
ncbi:MAG: anaerobic ribonucleoside-triphosphate reductase activating protein [Firmicutes bacterium]|jgi:anaerobic ribonucleoside-triphosphate reductase activating protein|nr:anaerobic ribonucleoside-triphosphate reductase activating protein [Bacillota bacterium]